MRSSSCWTSAWNSWRSAFIVSPRVYMVFVANHARGPRKSGAVVRACARAGGRVASWRIGCDVARAHQQSRWWAVARSRLPVSPRASRRAHALRCLGGTARFRRWREPRRGTADAADALRRIPMSKFKGELWAAACIAVMTAATGTALAQSPDDQSAVPPQEPAQTPTQVTPAPPPEPLPPPPPAPAPEYSYESDRGTMGDMRRAGFSLSAGGGVVDFTDQDLRDTTGVGGSWAVRATLGTKT